MQLRCLHNNRVGHILGDAFPRERVLKVALSPAACAHLTLSDQVLTGGNFPQ